jgi:hypothetical protein
MVRFQMVSLEFFIDTILPIALWPIQACNGNALPLPLPIRSLVRRLYRSSIIFLASKYCVLLIGVCLLLFVVLQ